jgi:hypothetical protein
MKKWIPASVVLLFVTGTIRAVPNPSAVFCTEMGYEYQTRKDPQGNQYGVCLFPDGTECMAWEYFRKCYYGETSTNCDWPCQDLPCKQAGESVYLFECCEGLKQIPPAYIYDANCSQLEMPPPGWLPICSDCGNGICEPWESKCNCPQDCAQPRIIYVDADAAGANDGSSWADAYNYLQDALADANSAEKPVEIRVAQGIYKPDQGAGITPGDREATFQLINAVTIKGGYGGSREPDPNARDIEKYATILSGDLAGNDVDVNDPCDLQTEPTRSENSFHIVTASVTKQTGVLNGFSIIRGNANTHFEPPDCYGGGIYNEFGSPIVANCTFTCNSARSSGAGMYNFGLQGVCSPKLTNCTFKKNWAGHSGAGMCNYGYKGVCSPKLSNCVFQANRAVFGGAIKNEFAYPELTNCVFADNSADWGGAIRSYYGKLRLTRCLLIQNRAHLGGAIFAVESSSVIDNCTLVRNYAERIGGGLFYEGSGGDPVLANSILWRNNSIEGPEIALLDGRGGSYLPALLVTHSDIQGGRGSIYAKDFSTLRWEADNIDADPCFADANNGDYHLKSQAGRWEPSENFKFQITDSKLANGMWVRDDVTSPCIDTGDPASPIGLEPFPNGGIINMGAYGGTAEASKSYFGEPVCETIIAGDINGDCKVDFLDFILLVAHWLEER